MKTFYLQIVLALMAMIILFGFILPGRTDLVLEGDTHKGNLYGCIEEKPSFSFKYIEKCWIIRK